MIKKLISVAGEGLVPEGKKPDKLCSYEVFLATAKSQGTQAPRFRQKPVCSSDGLTASPTLVFNPITFSHLFQRLFFLTFFSLLKFSLLVFKLI